MFRNNLIVNKLIYRLVFIVLLTIWLTPMIGYCQKSTSKILIELDTLFNSNYSKRTNLYNLATVDEFVNYLSGVSIIPTNSSKYSQIDQDLNLAKQQVLKRDIGLKLNGNYLDNQNTNAFSFDDNITMRRRAQTELEWNLLKGGLYDNRSKAKSLSYENKIDKELLKYNDNKELYLKRMNLLFQISNKQKIDILKKRESLIEKLIEREEQLYFKKQVTKEGLIEAQKRLAEIRAFIQVYEPYNQFSNWKDEASNFQKEIPVFDINYDLLFKKLDNKISDSLRYYFEQDISSSNRLMNQINLSAFTRFNYYQMVPPAQNRSYMSVGMNMSVPITFNASKKKEVKRLETEKKMNQLTNNQIVYQEELLNELYEFRYKLHQYVSFYYKRQSFEEQVRIEDLKRKIHYTYFSPLKAILLVDDLFAIDMELLELKQNMYSKLISIQNKLSYSSLNELVKPINMNEITKLDNEINRSIYVWSSIFDKQKVDDLFKYIKSNKFTNIILAYQKDDKYIKQKVDLIDRLKRENYTIELLIGQNNLLTEKDKKVWFAKVLGQYPMEKISAIHLDVEPHVLKEYKTKKGELLKSYITLLKDVRIICDEKKVKLTVSIPTIYPVDIVNEVYSIVDGVSFMCYENRSVTHLQKKLAPYYSFKDKTSIALRTEDFSSRAEMESFINSLKDLMPFTNYVFHDLKRLLELDKK